MIGGRFSSHALAAQGKIDILGFDNFSLELLFVEDRKIKRLAFVENGDLTGCVFTDGDLGIAQGVRGTLGLDLVDDFLELEGQVFGNNAGFLPGEDVGQRLRKGKRAVSVMSTAGWSRRR